MWLHRLLDFKKNYTDSAAASPGQRPKRGSAPGTLPLSALLNDRHRTRPRYAAAKRPLNDRHRTRPRYAAAKRPLYDRHRTRPRYAAAKRPPSDRHRTRPQYAAAKRPLNDRRRTRPRYAVAQFLGNFTSDSFLIQIL